MKARGVIVHKKIVFLFLVWGLFMGCTPEVKIGGEKHRKIMSVINQYTRKLKREEGLQNTSYGLSSTDGKYHTIALGYAIDKHMKYDEARTYFYSIVDGLLEHINSHPELEPYFLQYPVGYENLEFRFALDYHQKRNLKTDEVHCIQMIENEIFYLIITEEAPGEIEYEKQGPDVYIIKGLLDRTRYINRPVSEDLAMHSK